MAKVICALGPVNLRRISMGITGIWETWWWSAPASRIYFHTVYLVFLVIPFFNTFRVTFVFRPDYINTVMYVWYRTQIYSSVCSLNPVLKCPSAIIFILMRLVVSGKDAFNIFGQLSHHTNTPTKTMASTTTVQSPYTPAPSNTVLVRNMSTIVYFFMKQVVLYFL